MSELITGIISGIVATVAYSIFLLLLRPKICVSDKLCKVAENEKGAIIKIKVVNRTRSMLTNVKYVLRFCQELGDGLHQTTIIPPCRPPLEFIDKYSGSDKKAEYAVRFLYKISSDMLISEGGGWLEFSIHANHGFSNTSACVKKKYKCGSIVSGVFEAETSMKIIPGSASAHELALLAQ